MGSAVSRVPMTDEYFQRCRWFAHQPREKKLEIIKTLSDEEALIFKYTWEAWARDKQLAQIEAPGYRWRNWIHLAGRGNGKTRTGAEWIRQQAESNKIERMILVARTAADVRDTMVEGESGILAISPPWFAPKYEPSKRRLTWPNGSMAITFSADEPDALRGPQCARAWADERASWQYDQAWDNLMMGMRLGEDPQCIVTTTPRPTKAIIELKKAKTSKVTVGVTYENRDNLAPSFLTEILRKYENTRLGRQEIYAEILEDIEGALWNYAMLERNRVVKAPELVRVVVGVDPSVTNNEDSDETGIIVTGLGVDGHAYVLADYTIKGSPLEWATAVVTAYHLFHADRVVAEVNNGGDLVEQNVKLVDENISYKAVHASRGKITRAEPVVAIYEQGRAHHVGNLAKLEDEQCTWLQGMKSPNRLDACVWTINELVLNSGTIPLVISTGGTPNPLPPFNTVEDEEENARLQAEQERRANIVGVLQRLGGLI